VKNSFASFCWFTGNRFEKSEMKWVGSIWRRSECCKKENMRCISATAEVFALAVGDGALERGETATADGAGDSSGDTGKEA